MKRNDEVWDKLLDIGALLGMSGSVVVVVLVVLANVAMCVILVGYFITGGHLQ